MFHILRLSMVVFWGALSLQAAQLHTFSTQQLDPHFWGEGAAIGDINKDGHMDVVSGPYWYSGPDFKQRHEYYPATQTFELSAKDGSKKAIPGFPGALSGRNAYSDSFFAYTHDLNSDGWTDILILGFPGKEAFWYENPKGGQGHWKRHMAHDVVDNESPNWVDITGDGKPEILCNSKGYFGYVTPDWNNPTQPWTFHPVSPKGNWQRFTHGLGYGDVNGDGRTDVLDKDGWWEQPASLKGDPEWSRHAYNFSPAGGAQMHVYDVNGDGLNDVITSLAAHGYGLAWYEQSRKDGKIQFKAHVIMNQKPSENAYGVAFSQLHALELVDMNRDGLMDLVTGKRFWAHGPTGDAEPNAPAVLYWFELIRTKDGVEYRPHLIHNDSGIGTQVTVADINGDQWMDVIVGNKKGTFVTLHAVREVSNQEFQGAQPKRLQATAATPSIPFRKDDEAPEGKLPTAADGRPLNLDFEKGDLSDWNATGKAFDGQPILGPIDPKRPYGEGRVAKRQGRYWIGGYEKLRDTPTGTLTSVPFKITHPWATLLVGGGKLEDTRVELVLREGDKVFLTFRGNNSETMKHAVADLRAHQGKEMYIRIVDKVTGGWGHVNFDNFRFHADRPRISDPLTPSQPPPPADVVLHAGLSAEEAVMAMTLPDGFSATVFASEPEVKQPIAFTMDDRGRLWIAESYDYPVRQPEGKGRDRILILEDTDGDGRHDVRKVFQENLNLVSGLEVGFGGVWVGSAPHFLFIPDRNGDDKPDSEPQVLLDGWGYQDTHETLNTFIWGPDGWLYGCHGVFTHSKVGKPGTPDDQRTPINAGIWRYHPKRHTFEVFAHGTSNPWGVDFDDKGQCVIEACVIPHFFHIIQGARYQRQAGSHFNPHTYDDIKTIADHLHYLGDRPHAGNGRSDAVGGGHAHAGLMVYLGDSWPAQYRNQCFMNNIHGQRINVDSLKPEGSGYIGQHQPDFLNFNDRASQILNLRYDQDGSVFMIDWYDLNQCHRRDPDVHDRSNGRVFLVRYKNQKRTRVDLGSKSSLDLAKLQLHDNDWYVRHARRLLHERKTDAAAVDWLRKALAQEKSESKALRLLWALHVHGGLSQQDVEMGLSSNHVMVRAWTLQLACEVPSPSATTLSRMTDLAKMDPAPQVRLYLASACQRLSIQERLPILKQLLAHAEDADDHNLPLMYWYASEPVVASGTGNAVQLLGASKVPKVREYITRRMTAK